MRLISHILIARHMATDLGMSFIQRKAFIAGCSEPDCLPYTHLRGFFKGTGVSGHRWPNIAPCIRELVGKTMFSSSDIVTFFRLGRLCHYLVDAFTFPHNPCFPGTLSEHMEYEDKLHKYLLDNLEDMSVAPENVSGFSTAWVFNLHNEYYESEHNIVSDVRYSLMVLYAAVYALSDIVPKSNGIAIAKGHA